MSRAVTDKRVQRIVAAVDRAAVALEVEPDPERESSWVSIVASSIVTCGGCGEDFLGWPADACRAIVLAYALHAPEDVLEEMAEHADDRIAFLDEHDEQMAYEREHGHAPQGRTPFFAAYHPDDVAERAAEVQS